MRLSDNVAVHVGSERGGGHARYISLYGKQLSNIGNKIDIMNFFGIARPVRLLNSVRGAFELHTSVAS